MPMNRIQFQPGLSLHQFLAAYGTEAQCEHAIERVRWPEGFRCPACSGHEASVYTRGRRRIWQCCSCRRQTSLLAGTLFASSKLPLRTWFLAMFLITQSKNNISALSLMRQLGLSYPSAWLVKHKLMQVMAERESRRTLSGAVQIDDAYLGGERPGRRGTSPAYKFAFVAAVQTNEQGCPLYVRFDPVPRVNRAQINAWAGRSISPATTAVSDGHSAYSLLGDSLASYQAIVVGTGKAAAEHPQFRWVNTLIGNLKRALSGTYHAFKYAKYSQRYLAEYAYRFNRRFNMANLIPSLLHACARSSPRPESRIRSAEVSC